MWRGVEVLRESTSKRKVEMIERLILSKLSRLDKPLDERMTPEHHLVACSVFNPHAARIDHRSKSMLN